MYRRLCGLEAAELNPLARAAAGLSLRDLESSRSLTVGTSVTGMIAFKSFVLGAR